MDGLPDGGGVDPTGAIPLQIKALELTGEAPVEEARSVARGAEQLRKKRSSTRALVAVIAVLVVALVGGGGYVVYDLVPPAPHGAAAAPCPRPRRSPRLRAEQAGGRPRGDRAGRARAGGPAGARLRRRSPLPPPSRRPRSTAAPPRRAEPATGREGAGAKEPERRRPEPVKEAPARTARAEKRGPRRLATGCARARASAGARPPARGAAAKKKGDDLLDFDSNDAALDEALGGKGSSGRSVYVPPAPGGGEAQAERVTDSQVNETIMTRVSALQQCLRPASRAARGVLKMRWSIAPDGSVQNLKCISPENAKTPFAQCVTNVIKGLGSPRRPRGGRR